MINIPVFERIDISGYGLFPGSSDVGTGLHVEFRPGLTLILGANGLGKTTLINIIYRLLTGPFDISGLADGEELGYTRLTPKRLSNAATKVFANRVVDNARNAHARLSFRLGDHAVIVERRLNDLSLTHFAVDGHELKSDEETSFQIQIPKLAGIVSFSDWILLLRYLVFYFEDRRALVWDPTAQRQILRILFLPTTVANKWTDDERSILEIDSRMRNLINVLGREERALAGTEIKVKSSADIRSELARLEETQKTDSDLRERLATESLEIDDTRQNARLRLLKAEQEYEAQYRALERTRLLSIGARFPNQSETARYIFAQLLANQECIVCGNHVPNVASEYMRRIDLGQCVVCGSQTADLGNTIADGIGVSDGDITQAIVALEDAEKYVTESRMALVESENVYNSHVQQISEVNVQISSRKHDIDRLIRKLPPDEADIHKQRSELAILRNRVEELRNELSIKRGAFEVFIGEVNRDLIQWIDSIKRSFNTYAEGFLLEECELVWSPQKDTVGQTGSAILFPAFKLDMSAANFPGLVRRSGPQEVSESQREFIDLAFRMALMSISTENGGTSTVMDAPESSLDAVFSSRAATVLSRFAEPTSHNRLIITSNLVEGQLLPSLLRMSTTSANRNEHIVDLLKIAAPTAAIRRVGKEYDDVLAKLLTDLNSGENS